MLSSTIYTEPAGNASYSQETISSTLSRLYYLCNSCLENPHYKSEFKSAIVLDIAHHILSKPVGTTKDDTNKRSFFN